MQRKQSYKKTSRASSINLKEDIWALGVSLLQILENRFPLQLFEQEGNFKQRILKCDESFFYEKLNQLEELKNPNEDSIFWVIKKLLDPNSATRLTAEKALTSLCFRDLDKISKEIAFEEMQNEAFLQIAKSKETKLNTSNYENIIKLVDEARSQYEGFAEIIDKIRFKLEDSANFRDEYV